MTAQPQRYITEQEYIDFERANTMKHEYYDGHVYAMTGASRIHNLIAGNTLASLHGQLRQKPCQIFPSDMRIKVQQTGLYTYPDLVIICDEPQFTDDALDTLLNPLVLIEILSPSTERYDRGMKSQHYRTIETLQSYILIAQDHYHIEHYSRQDTVIASSRSCRPTRSTMHELSAPDRGLSGRGAAPAPFFPAGY